VSAPNLTAIRKAIVDVLEGNAGSVRTVSSGTFRYVEHVGHVIEKAQREGQDTRVAANIFDVDFTDIRAFTQDYSSALGNSRIITIAIEINVARYLLSRATDEDRVKAKDQLLVDCFSATQALGLPDNLTATLDGTATDIASGCLSHNTYPEIGRIQPDWENHLLRVLITATALVQVAQEV